MKKARRFPAQVGTDPHARAEYLVAVHAVVQWLARIGGACNHPDGIRTVSGGNVCTRCGIDTRAAKRAMGGP